MHSLAKLLSGYWDIKTVMDVGYGGLDGENTTDFLRKRFGVIDGICKDGSVSDRYVTEHGAKDHLIIGVYPQDMPKDKKFDLLVHDTNIEGNLDLWSKEGLQTAASFLNPGGKLIAYIMTKNDYGDGAAERLNKHREEFWSAEDLAFAPFVLENVATEERRPYIDWVMLTLL